MGALLGRVPPAGRALSTLACGMLLVYAVGCDGPSIVEPPNVSVTQQRILLIQQYDLSGRPKRTRTSVSASDLQRGFWAEAERSEARINAPLSIAEARALLSKFKGDDTANRLQYNLQRRKVAASEHGLGAEVGDLEETLVFVHGVRLVRFVSVEPIASLGGAGPSGASYSSAAFSSVNEPYFENAPSELWFDSLSYNGADSAETATVEWLAPYGVAYGWMDAYLEASQVEYDYWMNQGWEGMREPVCDSIQVGASMLASFEDPPACATLRSERNTQQGVALFSVAAGAIFSFVPEPIFSKWAARYYYTQGLNAQRIALHKHWSYKECLVLHGALPD